MMAYWLPDPNGPAWYLPLGEEDQTAARSLWTASPMATPNRKERRIQQSHARRDRKRRSRHIGAP